MKILFIACYSPYINNSAAIETLQYINKLSEINDNEVHLLTVDFPEDSIYYDKTLASLINKNVKVHLIEGGKLFNKLIPRKSDGTVNVISNNRTKCFKYLKKIKNLLVIPDMYFTWAKKAASYGLELMDTERFDVIFSMHEPPSSHLCAYYIKKQNRDIHWITYWSDPWLKDSTRQGSNLIKKRIEANMEKNVVSLADKFIFVTEDNRKDYIETYKIDKEKTFIITRGFDKILFDRLKKEEKPNLIKDDKINILYAGEIFSKLRDINPFVDGVNRIKTNRPDLYEKMNLLFFGNIDDIEARKKLEAFNISTVSKRIPFEEAIKYMLNSEVLLLFGNKNSKQVPAKIYEYFGAKGLIFVIYGDEKDPIKSIVENNDKCIATLNVSQEIEDKLIYILEKGKMENQPNYNYEWSTIVEKLNNILEV